MEDATVSNKAGDVLETNVSKVNNIGHVQWGDIRLLLEFVMSEFRLVGGKRMTKEMVLFS